MTEQSAWSWSELADLTHVTQVENFGFCTCEEQEQFPYDDCPRMIECPNHKGAFDCSPFCELCQGSQEVQK